MIDRVVTVLCYVMHSSESSNLISILNNDRDHLFLKKKMEIRLWYILFITNDYVGVHVKIIHEITNTSGDILGAPNSDFPVGTAGMYQGSLT